MKITKKLLVLVIGIMFLILLPSFVHAAGSYTISVSSASVAVGKTTTLTIKTTNAEGKFNITSSNPNVVAVGTASTWVSGSESITLTAKTAGTATITVTPVSVSDTELNLITAPKSVTVTVSNGTTTAPSTNTTKSGDATLKSITIGDKTYSGSALNSAITYTAGATVNSIKISATKNNSKATVSGTGTKSLVAGQTNKFSITVTAENGTKKTYAVNIIRLAEESTIPNIIDEGEENQNPEEVKLMLTSLIIKDAELSPEFNSEIYTYTASVKNIKDLEIDATASKPDAQINIEGATDLEQGDNIVKITIILGDEKIEYIIDVYNTIEEDIVGMSEDDNNKNDKFININDDLKSTLQIVAVCLLGIIAIRYMIHSYIISKKIEEMEEDEMLFNDDIEEEKTEVKNQNIVSGTSKIGRHF